MPGSKGEQKMTRKQRPKSRKEYESAKNKRADIENPSKWPAEIIVRFPGVGIPDKLRMRVKYTQTVIASSAVSPAAQVWNLNSIYQIDATGGTGNPSYYNAIGTLYKRYVVLSFLGSVEVFQEFGTLTTGAPTTTWAFQLSDNNTGSKTPTQMIEQKYVIHGTLPGVSAAVNATNAPLPRQQRAIPYTTVGQLNGQKQIENDPNFYTGIGANPTDISFGVFRCSADDGVTNCRVRIRLTLLQDVVWKDPSDLIT